MIASHLSRLQGGHMDTRWEPHDCEFVRRHTKSAAKNARRLRIMYGRQAQYFVGSCVEGAEITLQATDKTGEGRPS